MRPSWLLLPLVLPTVALADGKGSICLGPNLSIVSPMELSEDDVRIAVDELPPIPFGYGQPPKLVLDSLDLANPHQVKIRARGKVIQSWKISFVALGTKMVRIWRSKGYWHSDPVNDGICR